MSFKSSALFFYLLCLKLWGLDWLVRSHRRVSVGASRGLVLGRDKLGIRALGSLVSSHKNESSRVLRNGRGTPLLFFERLQDFRKIPFLLYFFRAITWVQLVSR